MMYGLPSDPSDDIAVSADGRSVVRLPNVAPYRERASDPDWVILGCPQAPGIVAVYGSTELTRAELALEADAFPDLTDEDALYVRDPNRRYVLTVTMPRFIMVLGPDYPSCIRNLLTQWEPRR